MRRAACAEVSMRATTTSESTSAAVARTPSMISSEYVIRGPWNSNAIAGARDPSIRRGSYDKSCSTRCTSARVRGATSGRPFTTLDTVDTDTAAADAICASVTRSALVDTTSLLLFSVALLAASNYLGRRNQAPIVPDHSGRSGQTHALATGQIRGRTAEE